MSNIHSTAVIGANAVLGDGVVVGPYTVIEDDVVIGDRTEIAPHVHIADGARIGSGCKIMTGAVLSTAPQDLKYAGEKTFLHVGDRTVVRECVTLNRGSKASGQTVVGSDCLIMAYVHTGHDCIIGNNVIIANSVQFGGHCEVGDYAVVGGLSGVHQFVRIGRFAMVGGVSRASRDVPPYVMAGGHADFRYEGLNVVGLKRKGFTADQLADIRMVYRTIFQSGMLPGKAIETVRNEMPRTAEVAEILEFFDSGRYGRQFIKPYKS